MSDLNGIINIKKPPGITSFRVVSYVKKTLACKKAGHTGTLDPDATGVLPVCLGKATKVIPYIPEKEKEYIAEVTLGIRTDTLDSQGEVIARNEDWQEISLEEIEGVVSTFEGKIEQIPPMYSAVHHNGKRLYKLARQGQDVEREARDVEIMEIEILHIELPVIKLRVLCSKGTYIRSLADDIGEELGVGAHLSSLIRTKSGPFTIDTAISFEELERLGEKALLTVDFPLEFPELQVNDESQKFASNGVTLYRHNFLYLPDNLAELLSEDNRVSIYYNDLFISISSIEILEDNTLECKPIRVFNVQV